MAEMLHFENPLLWKFPKLSERTYLLKSFQIWHIFKILSQNKFLKKCLRDSRLWPYYNVFETGLSVFLIKWQYLFWNQELVVVPFIPYTSEGLGICFLPHHYISQMFHGQPPHTWQNKSQDIQQNLQIWHHFAS